jgi:cytochrome c553
MHTARTLAIRPALIAVLTLALAACGGASDEKAAPSGNPSTPSTPTNPSQPGTPNNPPTTQPTSLRLPIEVLGNGAPNAPTVAEVKLGVDSSGLSGVTKLWFQCHRCGYYAAPEFEALGATPPKVKASVRVLGGQDTSADAQVAWVDVTDQTMVLADNERIHGGVNGGLYTTRIALTLDSATRARLVANPKLNRIQFRFNGTDGETNGFRILDLELRNDAGVNLATTPVEETDPRVERNAGRTFSADVNAGEVLWHQAGLLAKSSIVSRKINASCSSCHDAEGRDLQYFNYSNNAIVQRSRFHGLSETQGRQIAAYIRYEQRDVPYAEKGRPWNPPYQPGPGLDCSGIGCETQWAAGAGLDAVLETPAESLKALFGKPLNAALNLSQADVDRVMDVSATMNAREMQVPLQYPDWNAWLPSIHPSDVWPAAANAAANFEVGAQWPNGKLNPNGKYKALLSWFESHRNPNGVHGDWSHLTPTERDQIYFNLRVSGWEGYNYLGGGRGNHIATNGQYGAQVGAANLQKFAATATTASNPAAFTTNAFIERAVGSMLHWNAVKQWEIVQRFGLEGNQKWFIGEKDAATGAWKGRGEAHGWPFNTVSVFFLAPHMVYQQDTDGNGKITREWFNAWEAGNKMGSYYRTNQWYQMQMSINPGGQSDFVNYPMDWPYLTAFDDVISQAVGSANTTARAYQDQHNIRLLQAKIKIAQYANNGITLYDPAQPDLFANRGRYGRGQVMKHVTPINFMDTANKDGVQRSRFRLLDNFSPDLHRMVVNGAIRQHNTLYGQTDPAAWRRCDPNNTQLGEPENYAGFRYCLDAAKKPLGKAADGSPFMVQWEYRNSPEQSEQYGLWRATQMGADPQRVQAWSTWVDRMWP